MIEFPRLIVLEPRDLWWERGGVFNPAAVELGGRIHLLYRAVGADHISRFGLAVSDDGETFHRLDRPMFEGDEGNPLERLGVEDPRITAIGRELYITYTAASTYPFSSQDKLHFPAEPNLTPWRTRVSIIRSRDLRRFERLGVVMPTLDSKDAVLFPRKIQNKYWLLHRVEPSIYLTSSHQIKHWEGGFELIAPKDDWEGLKVGAGCPPLETEKGWLLIYHGVDKNRNYSMGAALLAKDNPAHVLSRTKTAFMIPHFAWEKRGIVNNVVFGTGLVVRHGSVWMYYGGADKVVALAKISLDSIFSLLE